MAQYVYHHKEMSAAEKKAICQYIETNGFDEVCRVFETQDNRLQWDKKNLGALLKKMQKGDVLIVQDAPSMACSAVQVMEILDRAARSLFDIHFVKYVKCYRNSSDYVKTIDLVGLMRTIESDFISQRTMKALDRRRAAGLPLGRPKGKPNKEHKLDKHRDEIRDYLARGISKASIAKLFCCHPQTLYAWIKRNNAFLKLPVQSGEASNSEVCGPQPLQA